MIKVQFISVSTLKDRSVIESNVDEKKLNLAIREFQELEIKKVLGETEYLRLEAAVLGSVAIPAIPLAAPDLELIEYIKPVMIYGAVMYSINPITNRFANTGIKSDVDQFSTNGDSQGARADASFKMEGFKRALIAFIDKRNTSTTPALCKSSEDTTFAFTGISLPDVPSRVEEVYNNRYFKDRSYGNYEH